MITFSSTNRFASVFCNNKIMVYKLELSASNSDEDRNEANVEISEISDGLAGDSSVHSSE